MFRCSPDPNVNVTAFRKATAAMTDHDANSMTNKFPELRGFIKGT